MNKIFLSMIVLLFVTISWMRPAEAQCILQPTDPGQNGQTRNQNFLALVHDLYAVDFHPTHRVVVNGKTLQAPPWFGSSTDCDVPHLQSNGGMIASPSFSDYLVVSDELSELAVVTALADDDTRMMEIHNTIQAMASTTYPGLPCWIAEVSGNSLTCRSQDTATDATARFGLAYYYAANNPSFLAASRAIYRSAGDALAARHLAVEYAHGCYTSPVTGASLCDWLAGGANTATAGVGGLKMWIGYFQDVARFLLAAAVSTGNSTYSNRAEEVVDQWLIASTFDGTHLTFGRTNFGWDTAAQPIAPRPGDSYYWQQGRAWDDSDASRALWMADVLRAVDLATHQAPLTGAYAKLYDWVQLLLANGTQTATSSCIQYNQNGTAVSGNCGTDYYYNGLGAGLYTDLNTAQLDDKLDTALGQYGWTGGHTWNSASCFGLYRGLRPVKALAASIGLDAAAYGGSSCSASQTPPAAPTWLRVDTVPGTATQLKLTWQDNSNNEAGFKVERKQGCCGPWTSLPDAPANSTGTAIYQNTGLQCGGTTYAYRVWAFNAGGTSVKTNEAARATPACN
jgi:hypothetical protein